MITTFDFRDGNGPVPAHKHPNGGGWVADTASVSGAAYIGPDAQVFGNARVFANAQVSNDSQVSGDAQVSGHARVSSHSQVSGDARVNPNILENNRNYANKHHELLRLIARLPGRRAIAEMMFGPPTAQCLWSFDCDVYLTNKSSDYDSYFCWRHCPVCSTP